MGRQRAVFAYPPKGGPYHCLAVSPDGGTLAILRHEKNDARSEMRWELTVWDLVAGRERFTARGVYHEKRVDNVFVGAFLTFRPDGKVLVGKACPTAVQLWAVDTGEELTPIPAEGWDVRGGAFRPDGEILALACGRTVRLWDLTKNQECACLRGRTDQVASMAFSPDGRTLATGVGIGRYACGTWPRGWSRLHFPGGQTALSAWPFRRTAGVSLQPIRMAQFGYGRLSSLLKPGRNKQSDYERGRNASTGGHPAGAGGHNARR
jgi:WD40 repeat protein